MPKKERVDWHKAAMAAIHINLNDYNSILEYRTEYVLGKSRQRIDFLIIKKSSTEIIPINFARFFSRFNLFEVKGMSDTLTTDAYYKAIGYASQLVATEGKRNQYTREDVTLTLLSMRYPRQLIKHLEEMGVVGNKTGRYAVGVEKISPGIYVVRGDIYAIQITVVKELPKEENRFLKCLYEGRKDRELLEKVIEDYSKNRDEKNYEEYMQQLLTAINGKEKRREMCEAIFTLFGTSSEEIAAKAKEEARKEAAEESRKIIEGLLQEVEQYRQLLIANGIAIPQRESTAELT